MTESAFPREIKRKTSQHSGATVLILHYLIDEYRCVCETHGNFISTKFKKEVILFSYDPGAWCSECKSVIAERKKKAQKLERKQLQEPFCRHDWQDASRASGFEFFCSKCGGHKNEAT